MSLLHTQVVDFSTMKTLVGVPVHSNANTGFMHIQCCNNRLDYWPISYDSGFYNAKGDDHRINLRRQIFFLLDSLS